MSSVRQVQFTVTVEANLTTLSHRGYPTRVTQNRRGSGGDRDPRRWGLGGGGGRGTVPNSELSPPE